MLYERLNDIDQIKNVEDLIQTQRWSELGQLAENIKELSNTMKSSGSTYKSKITYQGSS